MNIVFLMIILFFYVYSFSNIYTSSFEGGLKSKIIFLIVTVLLSPISYLIFSYGYRTNLSNKDKLHYSNLYKYSIFLVLLTILNFSCLTIIEPNKYGEYFLMIMGHILMNVFTFHILYPNHHKIIEEKKLETKDSKEKLIWFSIFPILVFFIFIYGISTNFFNHYNIDIIVLNIYLISFLIYFFNKKISFNMVTILSGPLFWIINYLYIQKHKKSINSIRSTDNYFLLR